MKRLFNIMMFVAVAAMGITACQNEPTEINVSAKKVTIEVIGELDATRSSFGEMVVNGDEKHFPSKWDGGEQVVFSLNEAALVTAENTGTGSKATFSVGLTDDGTTEGTIYAFSPKGIFNGSSATDNVGGFTGLNTKYDDAYVVIPDVQNPSTTSVDPAAHLLAGKATYTNGLPEAVKMEFNHAAAYGRMEITNFAEEITKVEITASEALAGSSCWYYYAGAQEGQLTNADKKTITINNPATDNKVFWFGCAPADLSEGTLEVKVYTADASYTKSINLTGKTLSFVQGQVSNFGVSMKDIAKDVVDETSYALVTSLADIEDGLYIIAGYNSTSAKYFALPAAAKENDRIAGTQVTVTDNKVSGVDAEGKVWTITKTGDYYTISAGELYFDYGESSTSLKVAEADSNNTWAITVGNTENTFNLVPQSATSRVLLFRTTNETNTNYDQFGAYSSGNATNAEYIAINLFKYGGTYKTALTTPEVTATADGNTITVSWGAVEGAANYTVSCDGLDDKTVTGTSAEYTELEYSTMYNFSVVANPTDTENNTASNPGTASATTEADPNAEAPTSGYKLITSMSEFTTGEYVIVGTNGTSNYAMPNQSTSGKPTATLVTIVDDVISTANASGFVWTITVTGTNCTIYNGSSYLGYPTSGTDFSKKDSAYNWAVSVVDNLFKIVPNSGTTRAILYRTTTGVFAPYAFNNTTNNASEYKYVSLYKKIENAGGGDEPDTPVQLAAPTNLSATATTNTATVTWDAVANASSYNVTVGITTKNVTTTTATFDGLTPDATYEVSVVAVGDGTNYTNSTEATTTVKTLADEPIGGTVVDVLTASLFTATSTAYTDFSGVTVTSGSGAVYSGNSSKTSGGAIQLRSKNSNSGIVTTTSGGKVRSITVTYESGSNTMDVYGKNTAYSAATDLYSSGTRGTKIGSISGSGTITITGDYEYIGIRSNSGALYITSIEITYEN